MKKILFGVFALFTLSSMANPTQLELDLTFGPDESPYQCVTLLEERFLEISEEVVFNIEKCTDEQIMSDLQVYMLKNTPGTDQILHLDRNEKSINDILDLLKTDHTEEGGSIRYSDRELLILPDFFAGKLEVQPNDEKKEIASISLSQDEQVVDFKLVFLYDESSTHLILLPKKISSQPL